MATLMSTVTAQPGGMNAAIHAGLVPATGYARGVNLAIRGGFVKTRPGWRSFSADIAPELSEGTDLFQGASVWRTSDATFIATVFSGTVRLTNAETGVTTDIGPYLSLTGMQHIIQAGPYLVFHGGGISFLVLGWDADTHAPQIVKTPLLPESLLDDSWDVRMQGIALSDRIAEIIAASVAAVDDPVVTYEEAMAQAFAEITGEGVPSYPHGTVSCFAHGRIHLSADELGNKYFYSSDLMLSRDQSSVLKWWENSYLNGGGGFGMPDELGEIRGMAVMQNSQDTASGIGPLIVLAQDGAAAFSIHLPREGTFDMATSSTNGTVSTQAKLLTPGWKDKQIAQVLFYGGGTESPWSLTRVNGDLVYRSQDGLRTVRNAISSSGGSLVANAAMSSEVNPFINFDSGADKLDQISAAATDNRVLMTAKRGDNGGHRGLISLDVCVLSTLDRTADDSNDTKFIGYDGLWTGIDVAKVLTLDGEFVAVATDGRMHRLTSNPWDEIDGVRRDIECQWITRQFNFEKPGMLKRFDYAELWLTNMLGDLSVEVYMRPDNFSWWTKLTGDAVWYCPMDLPAQERRRVRFTLGSTLATNYDGKQLSCGESFQLLVIWTGQATVQRTIIAANPESESPPLSTASCDFASIEIGEGQLLQNDFSYPG